MHTLMKARETKDHCWVLYSSLLSTIKYIKTKANEDRDHRPKCYTVIGITGVSLRSHPLLVNKF